MESHLSGYRKLAPALSLVCALMMVKARVGGIHNAVRWHGLITCGAMQTAPIRQARDRRPTAQKHCWRRSNPVRYRMDSMCI